MTGSKSFVPVIVAFVSKLAVYCKLSDASGEVEQ